MKFNTYLIYTIVVILTISTCSSTFVKNLLRARSCNKDPGIMSVDDKKIILMSHNKLRNQIAIGTNPIGPRLPYAQNMVQMYYSDSIGAKAQAWANKCTFKHSKQNERKQPQFKTGENIYQSTWFGGKPEKNWQKVIESWYSEINNFAGKSVVSFSPNGPTTGHFTQVIWANSYFVGCGYASYSNMVGTVTHLHVCQYGPIGNIMGFPIYKASTDKGCRCPAELSCNNVTFPGLCCPPGHCNHNSIEFTGEPFKGTVPSV